MLPFRVDLRPGSSPYRELVYAATKAVVSGELVPGSAFPSVRVLSQELKINPNTAQKAVAELVRDGLLEVRPGVGTVVSEWGPASTGERAELLRDDMERLLVESRRVGLTRPELEALVAATWDELFGEPSLDIDAAPPSEGPEQGGDRAAG